MADTSIDFAKHPDCAAKGCKRGCTEFCEKLPQKMGDPITVHLSVKDFSIADTFDYATWMTYVRSKLRMAGVPLDGKGQPEFGKLRRFENPKDFAETIYVWSPV